MVNSIRKAQAERQARQANEANKVIRESLAELFPDIPVFMNVLTEDELPENMTYLVIETDNYVKEDKSKSASETVGITLWSTNRPDPTLDHLYVILAGREGGLRLTSANNDFVIPPKTGEPINMFTATFHRPAEIGC